MSRTQNSSLRFGYVGAVAAVIGAILFELLTPRSVTPTPPGPETGAQRVVLTLDTSGSMQRDGKLEEMSRAAQNYLSKQDWRTTRVGIVTFDSGANINAPLSNDPNTLRQALEGLIANGATEMDLGLRRAAEVLQGEGRSPRSILLFTDGAPDSEFRSRGQVRSDTLSAAQELRDSGVRIVAVATLDADINFLAEVTGSRDLVFPASSGNFDTAFQQADRAIRGLFRTGGSGSTSPVTDALLLGGLVALCLGAALLVAENVWGLRGRWWRDVSWVAPAAGVLGAFGALLGQGIYSLMTDAPASRAIGWALLGLAAGSMLGLADRSRAKAIRGAIGGGIGGYLGGFVFDFLSRGLIFGASDTGVLPRLLGAAVLGFAIGLMVQLVQQAFKSAWLTGLTTGPYEGKQYVLSKAAVSVGRSDGNDIGLYRERDLAIKAGTFAFANGSWSYQGEPVLVNGSSVSSVVLTSGDTIRFGKTEFLFEERGKAVTEPPNLEVGDPEISPGTVVSSLPASPNPSQPAPNPIAPTMISPPAPPKPARWRLVGEETLELPVQPARVTLGRADDNQIVIHEASISGHHAVLEVKPDGLEVTDLQSTNGVIVNDHKLVPNVPTRLSDGDRVHFGVKQFTVRDR
jgi:Ca-activated chloride channel family protein